jgi:hypothetical protein
MVSLGGGFEEAYVMSSCASKAKRFQELNPELHEVRSNLVPFFLALAHDVLHMKHFPSSIDFTVNTEKAMPDNFITYKKAITIRSFEEVINFCMDRCEIRAPSDYDELMQLVREHVGVVPGVEEYIY